MQFEIKKGKDKLLKPFINGLEVEKSLVFNNYFLTGDEDFSQTLLNLPVDRVLQVIKDKVELETISLDPIETLNSKVKISIHIVFEESDDNCGLGLSIIADSENWNNPFTFFDYKKYFINKISKDKSFEKLQFVETSEKLLMFLSSGIAFQTIHKIKQKEVFNTANKFISAIKDADLLVFQQLLQISSSKTLTAYFSFPEQVKTFCEQYLLYFAQFLKDLGIDTTSKLTEEAGKVLFSVTPTDDIEALDKIREALEIYLRLPASPLISHSQDIAIQRLESQVEFFRSQIRLARAELQLKEATIQQQQVTIMRLGENVMIDSMVKDVTPKNSDAQGEILGGSVKLKTPKKLEDYGIKKIDLGKLWDYLKDKFKKAD